VEYDAKKNQLMCYPKNPSPDNDAFVIEVERGVRITEYVKGKVIARSGRIAV
jgi:hypothetical protein